MPEGASELLDLGCGYGPIALTLAARNPAARIWAIDVNPRARDLCRANATAAGLDNVSVAEPDEVPDGLRFDACWSNPPIRIGKATLHDLLERWLDRLTPDGSAHLVVQRHLGADSLARWLNDRGWSTTRRTSRHGYRLFDVMARLDGEGERRAHHSCEEAHERDQQHGVDAHCRWLCLRHWSRRPCV